jgi:hypothetical protein
MNRINEWLSLLIGGKEVLLKEYIRVIYEKSISIEKFVWKKLKQLSVGIKYESNWFRFMCTREILTIRLNDCLFVKATV